MVVKKQNIKPVLEIPRSFLEITLEIGAGIALLMMIAVLIKWWPVVPDNIPRHFGPSGMPDAWGGKGTLLFLPGVGIGLYLLLTIVSRYPHTFNYLVKITSENAREQYYLARSFLVGLKLEIIWLFTFIEYRTIQVALGKAQGLGTAFLPVFLIIIFGTIFFYFYRSIRSS